MTDKEDLQKLKNELKYGDKVELSLSGGSVKIKCLSRGRYYVATREEIVRQAYLYELVHDYNYSINQIKLEDTIKMGQSKKNADIVVYKSEKKIYKYIIVETKKQGYKKGIDQLQSYMMASGVNIGVWTNGTPVFMMKEDTNSFRKIHNIPKKNETLGDMSNKLKKSDLQPIEKALGSAIKFVELIKDLEGKIIDTQGDNAFDELFKLIFIKLYDEKTNLKNKNSECHFKVGINEDKEKVVKRIKDLFTESIQRWDGVFTPTDRINLDDENLIYCSSALQEFYFTKSKAQIFGAAFEVMINPDMTGDKGQYFTPRHVINMCVSMLNPSEHETVLDPACGSGGFLVGTMRHIYSIIDDEWDDISEINDHKKNYSQQKLFGIDYDPRLVKVSKAYMIIWGNGKSNVFKENSLNDNSWKDNHNMINKEFDIIMTNPPFAEKISSESNETLKEFNLAYKNNKLVKSQIRAVLFIEQCLKYLKKGGRMAIVLPQGVLNNLESDNVREFIDERARWLAVVGLHENTFKPFTNTKTSIVFLQKKYGREDLDKENYPIFTAVSKKSGKDKSGKLVYLNGKVDSDLKHISSDFIEFAKDNDLSFMRNNNGTV